MNALTMAGSKCGIANCPTSSFLEGQHYITVLGKVDTGNTLTFGATSPIPPTSVEARLRQ